jgi:hypothetical protein
MEAPRWSRVERKACVSLGLPGGGARTRDALVRCWIVRERRGWRLSGHW